MAANVSEAPVGVITHFFGKIRVATVRLDAPVAVGDRLHVKGANDDFTVRVKSMEINHRAVERAEAGQEVGIAMPAKAHSGDRVLRMDGEPSLWDRVMGLFGR